RETAAATRDRRRPRLPRRESRTPGGEGRRAPSRGRASQGCSSSRNYAIVVSSMTVTSSSASLRRRLAFAGDSYHFFDRLFCRRPLDRISRIGDSQTARIPDHLARIAFDLVECARMGRRAPDVGNVELALLHATEPVPQHPRYLSYWHDPRAHAMVGMIVGVDIIRHSGKYFVIELNHGPSIYPRRREMYPEPFDPIVS